MDALTWGAVRPKLDISLQFTPHMLRPEETGLGRWQASGAPQEGQGQGRGTLDWGAAAVGLEHIAVDVREAVGPQLDISVEITRRPLSLVGTGLGRWQTAAQPHKQGNKCLIVYGASASRRGTSSITPSLWLPQRFALCILQDKYTQKRHFQRHDVPVAACLEIADADALKQAVQTFGFPLMLKSRR